MPALQDSIDAIRIAAAAADRMKATDIVAFDVTEPLAITDAMLIASASNERPGARRRPRKSRRTCTSRPANASHVPAKA